MGKLETLIEVNRLEKENKRNRFEQKIRNQDYCCETEELFDLLTKSLKTNNGKNLALGKQTLGAINWQTRELDKQTKAISEATSLMGEHSEANPLKQKETHHEL